MPSSERSRVQEEQKQRILERPTGPTVNTKESTLSGPSAGEGHVSAGRGRGRRVREGALKIEILRPVPESPIQGVYGLRV